MHRRVLQRGLLRPLLALVIAFVTASAAMVAAQQPLAVVTATYTNPLTPQISGDGIVESCADPSVIKGQQPGDNFWYMYCTADPLNDEDRTESGFNFRLLPMLRSSDLVNWTYVGDAFTTRPVYATPTAGLWAPEIEYYAETGMYHLYYTVTETTSGGSAIGVATSNSPTGPWVHSAAPAVEPHAADCCPDSRRNVFDPEVIRTNGPDYIYYGSYFGGISVRELAENGLTSDPATQKNVAAANKYEGPEVIFRDGFYYLFVSATDCCRGPLTGYAVFVGRSTSPTGPFLDREGIDLNDDETMDDPTNGRIGGTPFLTQNGNRWVGPGHNTVFQDVGGQWWTIYHAIDRFEPYFENGVNIFPGGCGPEEPPTVPDRCGDLNKRPALLDPIDWVNGWPVVNGGRGPSDTMMPAPAAQAGETSRYQTNLVRDDVLGGVIAGLSEEFNGATLGSQWQWVREPASGGYAVENDTLRFTVQKADLFVNNNTASVLTAPTPGTDYAVETRVRLDVPAEGCCNNYAQAGLIIYDDDDNFIKLVHASIWNTRQTEFAKELAPVPAGYPRYGNTVVGPPDEWTYLRIVKRTMRNEEHYRAYTSRDGINWTRGGVWTHDLGRNARIGLVAMGQEMADARTFTANFDYVRVYTLSSRIRMPLVTTDRAATAPTSQ